MGGYISIKVGLSEKEAIALVQKDLDEFRQSWNADWWELRVKPHAELAAPGHEGWNMMLRLFLQANPGARVPEKLFIGSAWIHS